MKKIFTFFTAIIFVVVSFAQVPQSFNYQAVVRNNSGEILANSQVDLQIRILQDTTLDEVYVENQQTTTNPFGLVELLIGEGNNTFGNFADINWAANTTFIEISIKGNDTEYHVLGTSQLLSVPYALYADKVENTDDADADPKNELQDISLNGTILSLSKSDTLIDLKNLMDGVNDADTDTTNELIKSMTISGNKLIITEGSSTYSLDLTIIINDADSLNNNEIIKSAVIENNMLSITEGESGYNQKITQIDLSAFDQTHMSVNDADHDITNEIQELQLDTLTNRLSLSRVVGTKFVDLTNFTNDKQNLNLTNTDSSVTINIENGNNVTFSINDNDSVADNEIQTLKEVLAKGNDAAGQRISNIPMPTNDFDAVNKDYVDSKYAYLSTVFEKTDLQSFLDDTITTTYFNDISMEGLLIDKRDNYIYRIKNFGSWWMTDDLNYRGTTELGEFHEFNTSEKYGRVYLNSELTNICPDGWRLPTEADFQTLISSYSYSELYLGGLMSMDFVLSGCYAWNGSSVVWLSNFSGLWTSTTSFKILKIDASSYSINNGSPSTKFNVRCVK